MSETTKRHIIQRLANGEFVSGETLGHELQMSRTAVAKHIDQLSAWGLDIYSVRGKGYQLAQPLSLIDESALLKQLGPAVSLEYLASTDSTNAYLLEHLEHKPSGHIVVAERQTAGRGRQGRTWVSPFGQALYLSMYYAAENGYQELQGLSLVVGLGVAQALTANGVQGVQVKWPNDLLINGAKLGGILVELRGQMGPSVDAVIGLGINYQLQMSTLLDDITQPFTDCQTHMTETFDKTRMTLAIIQQLTLSLAEFKQHGFAPFYERWSQWDAYLGHEIIIANGQTNIQGVCQGIDQSGALVIEVNGQREIFFGGEIHVRRHNTSG